MSFNAIISPLSVVVACIRMTIQGEQNPPSLIHSIIFSAPCSQSVLCEKPGIISFPLIIERDAYMGLTGEHVKQKPPSLRLAGFGVLRGLGYRVNSLTLIQRVPLRSVCVK
jgi:hypothetical protein